jgi:predicted TIM-barrel fold metal-dependent hydrolase
MNDRIFIDANAMVGRRGLKDIETPYETEVLLKEMEWCGIQGALITHSLGKEYTPDWGNRYLLQELKKSPRLYGVWAVMPHHTGEMAPPRDVIQQMRDNDIRAAKMYPRVHHYFFNEDSCGALLSALEEEEILLILEGGGMYNPDIMDPANQVLLSELDTMMTLHPRLPVLLQNSRWDATRYLHTLMTKHTRLHLEFSNHQGNHALEEYAGWFGVERILFGTGALDKSPGAGKSFVDYCTLTDDEKMLVAGGNLARLLKLKKGPPPYRAKKIADPILAAARQGKPLRDTLVIDAHAHIAHDGAVGVGFIHQPFSDAQSMWERAKLMGIRQIHMSAWLSVWSGHGDGNEVVYDAMKRYPRFYHGYASLQPQYVKDWKREIAKVHGKYRMAGLKPYHPRTDLAYSDPIWDPWFSYGNRHRCYTLLHPSTNFGPELDILLPKYPDMTFILAHQGGSFKEARRGIEYAQRFPNVALEITLTAATYCVIEFMVEHVGADRVLFGTDQPMRDPIPQFGWMAYTHCTPAEKRKMFGLNMQKIVRRVRW